MITVTFDSNVWRPIASPAKFPKEADLETYEIIREAIISSKIVALLSETIFTIEQIKRTDRASFISSYKPNIDFDEKVNPDGSIALGFSIRPNQSAHPGLPQVVINHLNDARQIGFKLLHCPRIAGIVCRELQPSDYFTSKNTDGMNRNEMFGDFLRKIETAGFGKKQIQDIGNEYVVPGKTWYEGLALAPEQRNKEIASACSEWADGDSLAAHYSYKNTFFCTKDIGKSATSDSILDDSNRDWLLNEFGIKVVTPLELVGVF